ncbi:MAG: 2,3-bisphosphoglycerate-independent phosphoglycerate mutase [Candidatus Nitrosothermus koennekii]|nr:MAG: 2,3-bisphosphoglycerate-independent phosphoglycerate mutase [Candidatus Nitrosothermus koennekii]
MKLVYVLLDGVGDLPHPSLNDLTPLEAAYTPNMDKLARNGVMGQVYSVGKNIPPESDIAVFSMLGYKFKHEDYVGRGVIEAIGADIDLKDGDLALRGNFATIDSRMRIIDRRVGRSLTKEEAVKIVDDIKSEVKLTDATFELVHTTGHRVVLSIRSNKMPLSAEISNTDPAYERVKGMGVAKEKSDMKVQKCKPLIDDKAAKLAAKLVNEFTTKSIKVMKNHPVNLERRKNNMLEANCILLRDAGNRIPKLQPIDEMYRLKFSCIVDMPVEKGIAKVVKMPFTEAGGLLEYEKKAETASSLLEDYDAVYVHLKGPDEFGHDGDAWGKKKSIEDIDKRFFGRLLEVIDDAAVIISGDHSTPCIKKGHSADPVPLLVSSKDIESNGSNRFTENYAKKGSLGTLFGYQVLTKAIEILRS